MIYFLGLVLVALLALGVLWELASLAWRPLVGLLGVALAVAMVPKLARVMIEGANAMPRLPIGADTVAIALYGVLPVVAWIWIGVWYFTRAR